MSNNVDRDKKIRAAKEVLKVANRLADMKFDAAVGNPPYQITTGKGTATDVYPAFQKVSSSLAQKTSMVYPSSWQKSVFDDSTPSLGSFLIENGLKASYDYYAGELFSSGIQENFTISIVLTEREYREDIHLKDFSLSRDEGAWIDSHEKFKLREATRGYKKIQSIPHHMTKIANLNDIGVAYSPTKDSYFDTLLFSKKTPGKGSHAENFYLNEKDVLNNMEDKSLLSQYKVAIQESIVGRTSHWKSRAEHRGTIRSKVFTKNEAFSKTYLLLKAFPTHDEAENFSNYINTTFCLKLASLDIRRSSFASFVPDLEDYTNKNPLFTNDDMLPSGHEYIGLSLNDRLHVYFDLTQEV